MLAHKTVSCAELKLIKTVAELVNWFYRVVKVEFGRMLEFLTTSTINCMEYDFTSYKLWTAKTNVVLSDPAIHVSRHKLKSNLFERSKVI